MAAGAARRLGRQQPPLHLGRQRQVAPQLLLLQRAIVQPRVLDHQREDLRGAAQHLLLRGGEALAPFGSAEQQHADDLVLRAQRHRHPGAVFPEPLDLGGVLRPEQFRPAQPRLEVAAGERHRVRVVPAAGSTGGRAPGSTTARTGIRRPRIFRAA